MARALAAFAFLLATGVCGAAFGAAPVLYRTAHFESPVQGGPDELLFLPGIGFEQGDHVVYQAVRSGQDGGAHPAEIPAVSSVESGTAEVVKLGTPPYSLTVRLPDALSAEKVYRLWVVSPASQWSEPVRINDPRPLWISPAHVYSSRDFAGLKRRIRIVGRNLAPRGTQVVQVILHGPSTQQLVAEVGQNASGDYVAEALLPAHLEPGSYSVALRRGGFEAAVTGQKLSVLPDPAARPLFNIGDPQFGRCRANDDADDSSCLEKAIAAAHEAGGGTVEIPAGVWDFAPVEHAGEAQFVLPEHVDLKGEGAAKTTVRRGGGAQDTSSNPLLLLEGSNTVMGLMFVDTRHFTTFADSRAVIQLGHRWNDARVDSGQVPDVVRNVVISENQFRRVGIAAIDAGLPIEELFITHNDIGGYARGLELPDSGRDAKRYRIEDSVIRWNRFVPGSFTDVKIGQGVIATGLGASRRVDFSTNNADGASVEALQEKDDPPGWRAAFFWNTFDNGEMLLIADNRISCSGDKVGDGEAIAFDANGNEFGYKRAAAATASTSGSVTIGGELQPAPAVRRSDKDSYYVGYWIQVVAGPGLGQTRRITGYRPAAGGRGTVFEVSPAWDVAPAADQTLIVISRQFWQTYVVGNEIIQSAPTCRKANLSGPKGGEITMWAPSADSVYDSNRQFDTSGLGFTQGYSSSTPSCPTCGDHAGVEMALEIRGNLLQGEYDWSSDCSRSGIHGTFGVSPTPEAPPPTVTFGVQIVHNTIHQSDGLGGGAIDIVPGWHTGPEPHPWNVLDNILIAHNNITDMEGPAPRDVCHYRQSGRAGIRIEGAGDVTNTILYKNRCERTDAPLVDHGVNTLRLCSGESDQSCECGAALPK